MVLSFYPDTLFGKGMMLFGNPFLGTIIEGIEDVVPVLVPDKLPLV